MIFDDAISISMSRRSDITEVRLDLPDEFHDFYRSFYGDRWPGLFEALLSPEHQVVRWSSLCTSEPPADAPKISWLKDCWWRAGDTIEESAVRDSSDLLVSYIMDPASVLAAKALPLTGNEKVLDLCAAPGGKSLILLEALQNGTGELVANEPSPPRRDRLKRVLRQYVPESLRTRLTVKGLDGIRYGLAAKGSFDAVLVDAPCSGERHLMANSKERRGWKPARSQGLAKKQYSLLASAFESLKDQGFILYSTCSLSLLENDRVVERLLKRKKGRVVVCDLEDPSELGEFTEFGLNYLPDRASFGPLYFCLLQKRGE